MQRSGNANNKIIFTNYEDDQVIIQFPSSNILSRGWWWNGFRDYLVVNGFELIGAKYAILVQGDHNEVTNCKVHNTGSDGLCIWGGSYNLIAHNEIWNTGWNGIYIESRVRVGLHGRANYNVVEYNYCHDNSQHFGINIYPETDGIQDTLIGNIVRYNISENNKGGMYIRRWLDGAIYGNLFVDNYNNGLFLHHWDNTPPLPFPSNLKIYNNTFVRNTPYWSISGDSFSHITIKNNIFLQDANYTIIKIDHPEGCTLDYNLYYNTGSNLVVRWDWIYYTLTEFQNNEGQEINGLWADPLLASDYRLTANSPARDSGVDLGPPYNYDMDGHLRGEDGNWDIGGFEYKDTRIESEISIEQPKHRLSLQPSIFTSTTTICLALKKSATIEIGVYNSLGERVSGSGLRRSKGEISIPINLKSLPVGVYLCRVRLIYDDGSVEAITGKAVKVR
ncbi:MAG TPA: right-handed parallel beta-helix repeat-containing protein [bacterium (Candidatus Stahlbacteria)]|nr:right-handed parallel beta-helix repeat-containing protein [Candidatus Stahlbacteria bacterium]